MTKNSDWVMSPIPLVLPFDSGSGWLTTGMMVARDHVPIVVQVHRYDWLNVEYLLGAIERSGVKVGVALERHTDEVCDWNSVIASASLPKVQQNHQLPPARQRKRRIQIYN